MGHLDELDSNKSHPESNVGAVNYMAPMTVIAAALTYAWPFARSLPSLVVVAILYG